MTDLWRVARFEYVRHARQRRFAVVTLGLPVLMVVLLTVSLWAADRLGGPELPWGIVGNGNVPGAGVRFATAAEAESAVGRGEIDGFVELRPDGRALARATGRVPPELAVALHDRAQAWVLDGVPDDVRSAVAEPADLLFVSVTAETPSMTADEVRARSAAAIAVPMLFTLAVLFATGFLVQAVTEEKSSRVLEILVTSARHEALMAGKVFGLGLVSLTQTAVWAGLALLAAARLADRLPIPSLSEVPWTLVLASVPYFVLGYLLYATLIVGIGVVVGTPREAQQLASFLTVFLVLPFFLASALVVRPASPAAVVLSLVPLTSPVAMPMRLMMSAVPPGSWLRAAIVVVGRVFRATTILVGERPGWSAVRDALRA
jgi:ABC-2 type transport system permease protein